MYKDFYNYIVYDDGRVYSNYVNRFLKPYIDKFGYTQYNLYIEGRTKHCKIHRLIALLFIPNPDGFECVNHIDGNKQNNALENLEWCSISYNNKHARDTGLNNVAESNHLRWEDDDFRERVSRKISKTQKLKGVSKNEKNPRYRYQITMNGEIIYRRDLPKYLKLSQSYCDVLIRKSVKTKVPIFEENNIKVVDLKEGQQTIEKVA